MKITETKEVIKRSIEKVIVGRKCSICGKDILPVKKDLYNYFYISTSHEDWGNDSIDSFEDYDACSPKCVTIFIENYVEKAFEEYPNSRNISITHVNNLKDGAGDN